MKPAAILLLKKLKLHWQEKELIPSSANGRSGEIPGGANTGTIRDSYSRPFITIAIIDDLDRTKTNKGKYDEVILMVGVAVDNLEDLELKIDKLRNVTSEDPSDKLLANGPVDLGGNRRLFYLKCGKIDYEQAKPPSDYWIGWQEIEAHVSG